LTSSGRTTAPQTFRDVACTVCGCVCDDLHVTVAADRVTGVNGACALADPWFAALSDAEGAPRPAAVVGGNPAPLDEAVQRAAELLRRSRSPLIWGLSRSSTDGQRAAVALAEQTGATIDTTASVCHGPSIMAIQQVGESTSSLGEIRNRADLVVFWGANPAQSHPRHFERYSLEPAGLFVPRGRSDRRLVVIDCAPTETSRLADKFLQIPAERDFELIWALRALLREIPLPGSFEIGIPHDELRRLAEQLTACRYGVVFFGLGLAQRGLGHSNVDALLRLVADLNRHTRFTARRLRIPGDVTGADSVLCWQTGYPFAVSLSRLYPRYNPGEFSANDLLERGEVDAAVLVGTESTSLLSPAARRHLARIPIIALDYPHVPPAVEAAVQFTTAIYGIHAPGTAYRMDEIPIPLRRLAQSAYPTDHAVLDAIRDALRADAPSAN